MPKKMKKEIDKMVEEGGYASRSELVRTALRDWEGYQMWNKKEVDKVGKTPVMKNKLDNTDYPQW